MIKVVWLFLICMLWLSGCSSAPERDYQVTRFKRQAAAWLAQGDSQRQQGNYQLALRYYDNAFRYASRRHDPQQMGLARLKQAAVYISQGHTTQAEDKIAEAVMFDKNEHTELKPAIDFMRSKLAFARGQQAQALALVEQLQTRFADDAQRRIYYRWVGWQYAPSRLDWLQAEKDIQTLFKLKADKALNNIEVLSFVIYHNLVWRIATTRDKVPAALDIAIKHFASLELTNRLIECFDIAAKYYNDAGDIDRALYYKARFTQLRGSVN
ncbi:hypothetical protein CWB99_22115 [Pseudoalteromonas rubra]|uniref:Uncharacterized protein n=1 Tax=Pseudoalteromonas rubra TaxID=43658 RepID=A0A5S3WHE3_9GAMM|nr:hypothetical protein [Pseudoalteromonas rubra]TMP24441.1 hypothetical protein CWB99_22115 [Pseudoalteromonas rubra]TMP33318.1 hypothetical protein CWC00_11125 [Pseudoalteromonas rubra]